MAGTITTTYPDRTAEPSVIADVVAQAAAAEAARIAAEAALADAVTARDDAEAALAEAETIVDGIIGQIKADSFTIATLNTIPALSETHSGPFARVIVNNGTTFNKVETSPAFTISGTTVTWNATNAGVSLNVDDKITVEYSY